LTTSLTNPQVSAPAIPAEDTSTSDVPTSESTSSQTPTASPPIPYQPVVHEVIPPQLPIDWSAEPLPSEVMFNDDVPTESGQPHPRDLRLAPVSETEVHVVGSGVLFSEKTLRKMGGQKRYRGVPISQYAWHFYQVTPGVYRDLDTWVQGILGGFLQPDWERPASVNRRPKGKGKAKGKPRMSTSSTKTNLGQRKGKARHSSASGQGRVAGNGRVTFASTPNTDATMQERTIRVPRPRPGQRISIKVWQNSRPVTVQTAIHQVSSNNSGFVYRATFLQNGGADAVTLIISDFKWQIRNEPSRHIITFL